MGPISTRPTRDALASTDDYIFGMHGNGDDPIDDFPLGDGTADTSASVYCPYCGEENEIAVDPGSGETQDYIEDCQVCCQPWRVTVTYDNTGSAHVHLEAADDA